MYLDITTTNAPVALATDLPWAEYNLRHHGKEISLKVWNLAKWEFLSTKDDNHFLFVFQKLMKILFPIVFTRNEKIP